MTLPGWTREPLVHFLIGGALLYASFAWSGGNAVDPSSRIIDVDRAQQAELALQFERTMGRAPTDAELDAQIEQFVRDEVLYREALRLGLDQGDAVVRQRMITKMDMAAGAAAEVAVPSEDALREFYTENAARYTGEVRISFEQAFFADEATARAALARGNSAGEPISLPQSVSDMSERDIRSQFGEQFMQGLATLPNGPKWQGPIPSGFGWHLLKVTGKRGEPSSFEAVRQQVENDWRSEEIARRKAEAYQILRDAYRVDIDK